MASEWREMALGELAEIFDGPHATPPKTDDGPIFLGISNLAQGRLELSNTEHLSENDYTRWTRRIEPRPGDVVFSYETRLGEAASIPSGLRCCLGRRMGLLRARAGKVDRRFLLYAYLGPSFQETLRSRTIHGSTVDRIPLIDMPEFPLSVPTDINEQRAIAHILGTLDDKIELNRRMNETLEVMTRALFKSWFVDFDPVRAKAEGRDPGLPKHIADLFPDHFEDSELGEIPKGWSIRTIDGVAERVAMGPFGSSIKVETFVPEGVPVISGQHLNGFMLEDNKFNFITTEHAEKLSNSNVQRGDVVFTHAGNIGQAAFIPEWSRYERYVISQRQFFMRCDLSQVTPSFIVLYFHSPEGQHQLLANTSSSGVPSIARPVTYLRTIELVIPSRIILDAFETIVRPLLFRFRRNFDESDTLAVLRHTLLPKLISGEIRVKNAECEAERVGA
jgi:type I restriction enzyme S subunit